MAEQLSFEEYNPFFKVRLDFFDGPVDLLLHLVKQNELPIAKVALAEVATQYLDCIEAMRLIDLDVAGEYLVIAATLLSIKSSVLLDEPVEFVPDEDGNLIDPHEELLRRLREAEIYRDGAVALGKLAVLDVDVFAPPSSLAGVEAVEPELREHDPILLGRAFRKVLEQIDKEGRAYRIVFEPISVVERMVSILDILKSEGKPVVFTRLIPDARSRISVLGSFIALLELCKRQVIRVIQEEIFADIVIALAAEQVETESFTSEFDGSSVYDGAPERATVNA